MRRFEVISLFLAGLGCICGCQPTPYQRLGATPAGGYSETRFAENEFHVKFVGNYNTPPTTVRNYLYRRAAELTLEKGFKYFDVIRGPSPLTERRQLYQSPDHWKDMARPIEFDVPDPRKLHMTIQCFKDAPEDSDIPLIDAGEYLQKHVGYEAEL
jgi:hypothetical protein